jgi:hypothetical protein
LNGAEHVSRGADRHTNGLHETLFAQVAKVT